MELVSYDMPWKPQVIMPVGDIQWFGDKNEVALEKLRAHIAWGVERDAWFIGMGDYVDAFSPSNRQRLRAAGLYDNAERIIDDAARRLVDDIYDVLKPSKGRWLGMLAGHHFAELRNGTTSDQLLCEKLASPFLGDCAYVRLRFQKAEGGSNRIGTVTIWAHHGQGSGQSITAPVQKLEKLPASWDADLFLMGHHSKVVAAPLDRCYAAWPHADGKSSPALYYRTVLLVGTGSFMKGYVEGRKEGEVPRGTYVEKGMMRPVSLGAPVITVTPRYKKVLANYGNPGMQPNGYKKGRPRRCTRRTDVWLPDLRVSL